MKPEITIIVPAFNEEKYIKSVFQGLKKQTFHNFEIIVVDGNSTDQTREIAKRNGGKIIIEPKKNIGAARNTGARFARGSLILFTNADTMASKNLLKIYKDAFMDKNIVAASGALIPLEKSTKLIRFGYRCASVYLAKMSFATKNPAISGSNFMVRKSTFKKCGGFDESLYTYEDLDLAHRLARMGQVKYIRNAIVATSTRRIVKWGILRYVLFNTGNVLRYNLFHKSKRYYEPIR
jgi:glycosyltransferase involved in cell wall biosynthesis